MFRCIDVQTHGPAATLQITDKNNGRVYSVDLVLVIKDKSWPEDAEGWRQRQRKGIFGTLKHNKTPFKPDTPGTSPTCPP